jgi:putative transposase
MVAELSRSNAVAESFFKTLKYDGNIKKLFKNKQEAKLAVFEFIEVFYNNKRRHSSLNYLTPNEAERYLKNRNNMIA